MSKEKENTIFLDLSPLAETEPWRNFVRDLRYKNRFTLGEASLSFVERVLKYASEFKVVKIKPQENLYRARVNNFNGNHHNLEEMGAPPLEKAGNGRLNPKGIPYLYLASDKITAISEVRPWVGCHLTVARFNLVEDVKIINFSKRHFYNEPQDAEFRTPNFVWNELITFLFSSPFDPRDDTAYIPTQYLAERIKGLGFDGIMYDSSINSDGYNVTLFSTQFIKPMDIEQADVTLIKIEANFSEIR